MVGLDQCFSNLETQGSLLFWLLLCDYVVWVKYVERSSHLSLINFTKCPGSHVP